MAYSFNPNTLPMNNAQHHEHPAGPSNGHEHPAGPSNPFNVHDDDAAATALLTVPPTIDQEQISAIIASLKPVRVLTKGQDGKFHCSHNQCSCGKKCRQRSQLRHLDMFEKSYKCVFGDCIAQYGTPAELRRHIETKHAGGGIYCGWASCEPDSDNNLGKFSTRTDNDREHRRRNHYKVTRGKLECEPKEIHYRAKLASDLGGYQNLPKALRNLTAEGTRALEQRLGLAPYTLPSSPIPQYDDDHPGQNPLQAVVDRLTVENQNHLATISNLRDTVDAYQQEIQALRADLSNNHNQQFQIERSTSATLQGSPTATTEGGDSNEAIQGNPDGAGSLAPLPDFDTAHQSTVPHPNLDMAPQPSTTHDNSGMTYEPSATHQSFGTAPQPLPGFYNYGMAPQSDATNLNYNMSYETPATFQGPNVAPQTGYTFQGYGMAPQSNQTYQSMPPQSDFTFRVPDMALPSAVAYQGMAPQSAVPNATGPEGSFFNTSITNSSYPMGQPSHDVEGLSEEDQNLLFDQIFNSSSAHQPSSDSSADTMSQTTNMVPFGNNIPTGEQLQQSAYQEQPSYQEEHTTQQTLVNQQGSADEQPTAAEQQPSADTGLAATIDPTLFGMDVDNFNMDPAFDTGSVNWGDFINED
ncbi:hypothetical protein F4818DRAFT_452854 [Hypoxylon cercidicola]|nr:hypothetical protein F4818DRAFT_452854 [Hypoxylon cercidicola]